MNIADVVSGWSRADTKGMNTHFSRIAKAVAVAAVIVPLAASSASAAPKSQGKRATWTKAAATTAAPTTTTAATTTSTPAVTAVHAIGGYVFYNVSYLEAVNLYFAAVAAAPAGYTPPPVTSVSVSTTVSGTVPGGN